MTPSTKPSSNWLALQKVRLGHPRKRKRGESSATLSDTTSAFPRTTSSLPPKPESHNEHIDLETTEVKNGESIAALRRMVLGKTEYKTSQSAPGKYVALDCEMVGVGIEGNESSLARVSIVNYKGATILDVFVRQREKVVDYRTQWSGVRSTDLAGSAKPFKEVQQAVADLIKDRILVGHAIYNDLKIRDTQSLAYKHRVVKSRRPALRVLVRQELGIVIQGGEHSSVTDARATMALFRLYKRQWESGFRSFHALARPQSKNKVDDDSAGEAVVLGQSSPSSHTSLARSRKRGRSELPRFEDDGPDEAAEASSLSSRPRTPSPSLSGASRTPTGHISTAGSMQRKGISSGISTVTRRASGVKEVGRKGTRTEKVGEKGSVVGKNSKGGKKTGTVGEKWWKSLGGGKKGSIKL
ncbi:ribonuclease H-like protein [Imleria badia]|nr:ribonuclease H-like protein [Imleria badia]